MYSTPGISQSNFSIGRVARSSTSFAPEPGMDTSTSTIGTLICGSSSRGSITTANPPSSSDAMTISSVSLESMNVCAMRPARPGGEDDFGDDITLESSKHQHPTSREAPRLKLQTPLVARATWCLMLEHSLELGAWNL